MSVLDWIEGWVKAHDRRLRRVSALVVGVWLVGWVPSVVFTEKFPHEGPQIYAWWIILVPLMAFCAVTAGLVLAMFYAWALGGPSREQIQERIARLERELGIGA